MLSLALLAAVSDGQASTTTDCTSGYFGAARDTPGEICAAIDALSLCISRLAENTADGDRSQLEQIMNLAHSQLPEGTQCHEEVPDAGTEEPALLTDDGNVIIRTHRSADVTLHRYNRDVLSLWELDSRISTQYAEINASEARMSTMLAGAIQALAAAEAARLAQFGQELETCTEACDGVTDTVNELSEAVNGRVTDSVNEAVAALDETKCIAKQLLLQEGVCVQLNLTDAGVIVAGQPQCAAGMVGRIVQFSDYSARVCSRFGDEGSYEYEWTPLFTFGGNAVDGSSQEKAAPSCKAIKEAIPDSESGIYWIVSGEGLSEQTHCEMQIDGGGWTLVSSVHEDDRRARCNNKDRWSSDRYEDGSSYVRRGGPRNWVKDSTFGTPARAAQDDFKAHAYYHMEAKNMMILNVPNGQPMQNFFRSAIVAQYTDNDFLDSYSPKNLIGVFNRHPVEYNWNSCNSQGPRNIRVNYAKSNDGQMEALQCPNCRGESDPGYWSFSQCNCENSMYNFCQVKRQGCNIEHFCLGNSWTQGHGRYCCNDHQGWDWHDSTNWNSGWTVTHQWYHQATLFYYRE